MKITKEMLAAWRGMVTVDGEVWGDIRRTDLHALLDERKALRAALRVCVPVGSSSKEQRDLALLGGEDEE